MTTGQKLTELTELPVATGSTQLYAVSSDTSYRTTVDAVKAALGELGAHTYIQSDEPTAASTPSPEVGDLWMDTPSNTLYICTTLSPLTFTRIWTGENNVQANWTQTDNQQDSFILNKPSVSSTVAAAGSVATAGSANSYSRGDHSHGGATDVESLSDVDVSVGLDDGDILHYDAGNSEWKPQHRILVEEGDYSISSSQSVTIGDNDTKFASFSSTTPNVEGNAHYSDTFASDDLVTKKGEDDATAGAWGPDTWEITYHTVHHKITGDDIIDQTDLGNGEFTLNSDGMYVTHVQCKAKVSVKSGFTYQSDPDDNQRADIDVYLRITHSDGTTHRPLHGNVIYLRSFHRNEGNEEDIRFGDTGDISATFGFHGEVGDTLAIGFACERQGSFRARSGAATNETVQFTTQVAITDIECFITRHS